MLAVAGALLLGGRLTNPQALALVSAAPLFGAFLMIRVSPWLIPLDILAAAGLLVLGVSLARSGSVFDLSISSYVHRGALALFHGLAGPAFLASALRFGDGTAGPPKRTAKVAAVLRGALLAVPLIVVVGLLLASADVVFARLVRVEVDATTVAMHLAGLAVGAWGMAGLLRVASSEQARTLKPATRRLGHVEAAVILGSLNLLFAMFAFAQLYALSAGGRTVIQTAGLTYATYARSGFFQLLAVAAIALAVLVAIRALTRDGEPWPRTVLLLSAAAVVLTLAIVFVSIRRLGLYEQVFGLTMLRLYSTAFAYWIGAVFLLFAAWLFGLGRNRMWFPSAAIAAGLLLLLALNVVNPEAVVVRHNVEAQQRTERFDPSYLAELSDDAIPTLLEMLPTLPAAARTDVLSRVCPPTRPDPTGWAAFNGSKDSAFEALTASCGDDG